jgi:hypothetical protein
LHAAIKFQNSFSFICFEPFLPADFPVRVCSFYAL